MLEFIDLGSDHVVGIRLQQKLTDDAFDKVAFTIAERLNRHDKINLYVEIPSFEGMSVETFLKDLQFGLRNWRHFKKEAVVTDKVWLRNFAETTGKFLPGIEVKGFTQNDAAVARQWVLH
jgi:hypothetical protein